MNLRHLAEQDLGTILEAPSAGAGWPVTLTAPDGTSATLGGMANDISQVFDPETGQLVSGRVASVELRLASIRGAGFTSYPEYIADSASKPWVVVVDDLEGTSHTFKVRQGDVDRSRGVISCTLEVYA